MKKRGRLAAVVLLVSSLLLLTILPASATAAAAAADDFTYTVENGAATITGYTGKGGEVIVPGTLGGCRVTAIQGAVFDGCQTLTAVTLPEGLTEVSEQLFFYCKNLRQVTLPDSVTKIGSGAFNHCQALTDLRLPDGITVIDANAFLFCVGLTGVDLPKHLLSLGSGAFSYCTNLKRVTLPEGLTSIGYSAFSSCSALTDLTLPSTLKTIGSSAFLNCTSLTKLTIPQGVTSLADTLFYGCTKLRDIGIPSSVSHVGDGAFLHTAWLANYPGDFVLIGTSLYQYRGTASEVTVPDGVTELCNSAFYKNEQIVRVVLPRSVLRIGYGVFNSCSHLKELVLPDTIEKADLSAFWETPWYAAQTGYVTAGKVLLSYQGSDTALTLPDTVTAIGAGAFSRQQGIQTVRVPAAVESIGENNFMIMTGGGDGAYSSEPMDLTLQGYTGSFAQQYAVANHLKFQSLGQLSGLPTRSTVVLNGTPIHLEVYNINGHNFFKLRDLAYVLSGTNKQMEVTWNNTDHQVLLSTGLPYSPVGGEGAGGDGVTRAVAASSPSVFWDGMPIQPVCYLIHDNNFVKLRDILCALNIRVDWDDAHNTVSIDTTQGYVAD